MKREEWNTEKWYSKKSIKNESHKNKRWIVFKNRKKRETKRNKKEIKKDENQCWGENKKNVGFFPYKITWKLVLKWISKRNDMIWFTYV